MIRVGQILIVAVAGMMLGGMMLTNPDYNSVVRPFVTRVPLGESGQTRTIAGSFVDWRSAKRLEYTGTGDLRVRDTEGVFLIVDLALSGTRTSSTTSAIWIGASKRRYSATDRMPDLPGQIEELWVQPGLESKTFAIFELPPDEIMGGTILLGPRLSPPLDGTLLLESPTAPPVHESVLRLSE